MTFDVNDFLCKLINAKRFRWLGVDYDGVFLFRKRPKLKKTLGAVSFQHFDPNNETVSLVNMDDHDLDSIGLSREDVNKYVDMFRKLGSSEPLLYRLNGISVSVDIEPRKLTKKEFSI